MKGKTFIEQSFDKNKQAANAADNFCQNFYWQK